MFSCLLELPEFQLPDLHEILTAPPTLHRYVRKSVAGATQRYSEGAPMHQPSPGGQLFDLILPQPLPGSWVFTRLGSTTLV